MFNTTITTTLIVTGIISIQVFASKPPAPKNEITKIYEDYLKNKTSLLKTDLNKKNIKDKLTESIASFQKSLDDIKKIEAKSKDDLFTAEGNQIAFDIETLTPLKNLASGLITKEDCDKAEHMHNLNFPIDYNDDDAKAIERIITNVCTK